MIQGEIGFARLNPVRLEAEFDRLEFQGVPCPKMYPTTLHDNHDDVDHSYDGGHASGFTID
eukprot:5520274-Prorocentrum_lima.AAC.1